MSHPDPTFAWVDEAAMRAFVARRAFATIVACVDGRPRVAHAPLSCHDDGTLRFHLSRRNALTPHLDGLAMLAAIADDDHYVSPDWYGMPDQVPTWNYRLVEVEGVARRLNAAATRAQVDAVSAAQETPLAPKRAWTSAKMREGALDAMLRGIVGFAIDCPRFAGTAKLSQNKPAAARAGVVAALRGLSQARAAAAVERA